MAGRPRSPGGANLARRPGAPKPTIQAATTPQAARRSRVLGRWPIRVKLLVGMLLLAVSVCTLAGSGFLGLYAYRGLVKSLAWRLSVLPVSSQLTQRVSDLRLAARATNPLGDYGQAGARPAQVDSALTREEFRLQLQAVEASLARYREQLVQGEQHGNRISSSGHEWQTVKLIEANLAAVARIDAEVDWVFDPVQRATLHALVDELQFQASELPGSLYKNINDFALDVRSQYRPLIVVSWVTAAGAILLLGVFVELCYLWVFRPLRILIDGSRQVASGRFEHRIRLETQDEMAELAEAMNDMTARFMAIRDDLDRQVQERTKQVVRSEQLASVGFLAAGVAHEINNPLASIALCAESLEGRMCPAPSDSQSEESQVVVRYLKMIQDEAFRCKEITEKLLDFSRLGELQRQPTELRSLVEGVVEMVRHLGQHQTKTIELRDGPLVWVEINPQEIKQVTLNLLTNALDSLEPGGQVEISLAERFGQAELTVQDNGCGMTPETLRHLFEPFFTRRRGGQGTGLGLSITYRIVADHGGQIEASSEGPGRGSQFRVRLPLATQAKELHHRHQAA